ncbi:MAG: phosphatidylcholine/phosphatidylserine synthase [Phycisphaerales bacterium]|jgi:CDP-diacylglycerol--serine O-phosphatidyltransferase
MPKLRTQAAKNSLLSNVRKQRLNYITVLPSLITLINGLCGFTAIFLASKATERFLGDFSAFSLAAYMVLLAMIADVLDGRVARISQNTSSFGGQLDSLCDIISFGAAPAFLMLMVMEHKLASAQLTPIVANYLRRFFWLAAAAYVSCTAIRLARFNVENEEDESAHMSFMGLPAPAGAGVIVSLVILHQEMLPELADKGTSAYLVMENSLVFALPFVIIGTAFLMVSRIRYSHVLNQYFKGKKPFAYLMSSLLVVFLVVFVRQLALVVGFGSFAISGLAGSIYRRIVHSKAQLASEAESPGASVEPADSSV